MPKETSIINAEVCAIDLESDNMEHFLIPYQL